MHTQRHTQAPHTHTHTQAHTEKCFVRCFGATLHGLNDCCLGAVSVTVAVAVTVAFTAAQIERDGTGPCRKR